MRARDFAAMDIIEKVKKRWVLTIKKRNMVG
jgi:hypothetical protein